MASAGSRRNAVRFELQEDLEMDRLQFSRYVIQKELGFSPPQLDYVFALPGRRTFEVIFTSYTLFEQCLERYYQKKDNNPRLQKVLLIPLSERETKAVTVIMYSEKVTTEDISTWLSFHCTVLRSMELKDEDGIRTGARRFYVRLKRGGDSGRLQHLPSSIQLGPIRGHVFYAGQPKNCRKCGSSTHLAANCNTTFCRNCKSTDHFTKDCDQPMRCNLCGSNTHTFRGCPESYANRARGFNQSFDHPDPPPPEEQSDRKEQDTTDIESEPSNQKHQTPHDRQQQDPFAQDHPELPDEVNQQAPIPTGDHREPREEETTPISISGCQIGLPGTADHQAQQDRECQKQVSRSSNSDTVTRDNAQSSQMTNQDQSEQITMGMQQSQEDLPARQTAQTSTTEGPVSSRDCRDLLDLMLVDLTLPGDTASTSQHEVNQVPSGDMDAPPTLSPLPDFPLESTPSRKRPQELSGDSSNCSPEPQVWSDPLSPSSCYLDPQVLSAFSVATQMTCGIGGGQSRVLELKGRRKKRKKDNPPHRLETFL